jgi:hypothetical protein
MAIQLSTSAMNEMRAAISTTNLLLSLHFSV